MALRRNVVYVAGKPARSMIRHMAWYCVTRNGVVWCCMVWYDLGLVWYGMVGRTLFGPIWCCMVYYNADKVYTEVWYGA